MTGKEDGGRLPRWRRSDGGTVMPEERLGWGQTLVMGVQHVVAMFGATVLAPLLMGFDPNVAILFSGVGTLIFFLAVGGRVPSYLGSSFSLIAVVIAATAYAGSGPNPNIAVALGGIVAAGALYLVIGLAVMAAGHRWLEALMPPVVTGAVIAAIGLNLAPIAVQGISASGFDTAVGLFTVLAVAAIAVYGRGLARRLSIILGAVAGTLLFVVLTEAFGLGAPLDLSGVAGADWIGWPAFTAPRFEAEAMALIAPVAVILVAENLGHVKAIGAMTGRSLDRWLGRAFVGDAVATMVSASGGGTGVTTYAENIGVMAVTRIYSSLVFVAAALVAILLGFSPKFGQLILAIPGPVVGGLSFVVFGLITATAGRIWVEAGVDFSKPINLIVVGVALVAGAGDLAVDIFGFTLGGIGTATFGAILLYQILNRARAPEA